MGKTEDNNDAMTIIPNLRLGKSSDMKSAQWFIGNAAAVGRERIIVLASASKDRLKLLQDIGLHPLVVPSDCAEDLPRTLPPAEFVEQTARQKARAVQERLKRENTAFDALIGCDTMVHVDGQLIGKPRDQEDALAILKRLNGRVHAILTGVCLIDAVGQEQLFSVESEVEFGAMDEELLRAYVQTGEPFGRAGAYAIQTRGAVLAKAVHGSFSNVVGLPVHEVAQRLREMFKH